MTYNAANRKDVRRVEKQARLNDRARKETVGGLMSTQAGREWVYQRLTQCHVFATSFSLNAYEAAFREGERNVGLQILNDVQQFPDEYVLMMREANVRDLSERAAAERVSREDPDWDIEGPDPGDAAGGPAGDPDPELEAG